MFLDYYGLNEQPFGVTPDPRFLYLGPKHRQALAALEYGTDTNRGFLTLIAKPGMGKTSLLFRYLEGLRTKARTAFVFQTDGDSRDLMRYLLADLGLDGGGKDLPEMHALLNRILLEEVQSGRQFVLVIDEAQNLDEKVLESVRLLSNFETPQSKLMQIVLAGQPQLAERLASASMSQLRQRISFIIRIEPFTREEVATYVDHRLLVAGYKGPSLFTDDAQRLIAEHSEGIPRNINNICFNAMTLGWALKQKTIDGDMVRDIVADLDLNPKVFAATDTPNALSDVAITAPAPVAQPAIPTAAATADSHPAQAPIPSPLAESGSAPPPGPKTNEPHPIRPVHPATASSLPTEATPGTKAPPLGALGISDGSRSGFVIVAASILLVASAVITSYRLYGQGPRVSDRPAAQQAVIFPQNQDASPVLSQVDAPVHDTMTAALNPTSVSLTETATAIDSHSVSTQPVNLSGLPPGSVARSPLSTVSRNDLAIGNLKTPTLKTMSSASLPIEAPPIMVGVVNDLDGIGNVDSLLGGTGTDASPPSPNSRPLVGGQLQPPQLISSPPPVYPAGAHAQGVQGVVVLDALVDETGKVVETTVIAGPVPLQSAAREALQNWKYQPARLNGEPIQVHIKVSTRFSLN
jgi:general secretion pathway protein A